MDQHTIIIFITKQLAKEFKGYFHCFEKYITFSVPIKKVPDNDNDNDKTAT